MLAAFERLSERGSQLRVPASRSLGEGLFELRIDVGRAQQRITYLLRGRPANRPADRVPQATTDRAGRDPARSPSHAALHR